jgi:hypothetical protein
MAAMAPFSSEQPPLAAIATAPLAWYSRVAGGQGGHGGILFGIGGSGGSGGVGVTPGVRGTGGFFGYNGKDELTPP